jgi:polysaccharide pyruvyl transferase WcaK-like protein
MAKIAHVGAYDTNLGDNIALRNVRVHMDVAHKGIEWKSVNLIDFYSNHNQVAYCKERFQELNDKCDMILFGGGGLIEGSETNKHKNGCKIPLNEEILSVIKKPIVIFGVGVNYFRGSSKLQPNEIKTLKSILDRADLFSVRNDGSFEILQGIFNSTKIREIPDPGLMMGWELQPVKTVSKWLFQPVWNNNEKIVKDRGFSDDNLHHLSELTKHMTMMPHTIKDYEMPDIRNELMSKKDMKVKVKYTNTDGFVEKYKKYEAVLAMRGHGQLISIGINMPGIYLSTQDKVSGFSKKNGFENYTVDINDVNWNGKVKEKVEGLKDEFLERWYEIRNAKMKEFRLKYKKFISDVVKLIDS